MHEPMEAALKHARFLAKYLNKCGKQYVIQIALKETGMRSSYDGFHYAEYAAIMLCENPFNALENGIYPAVGLLRQPPAGQEQVEQSIRFSIRKAWRNRTAELWAYYFPEGCPGCRKCPTNRDYLMAIVDFVELWKGCCEEVNYETI